MTEKLDKLIFLVEGLSLRITALEEKIREERYPRLDREACNRTFNIILHVVATVFGVSQASIMARRKYRGIVYARQVAIAFTRKLGKQSLHSTGRLFKKDHTTVAWAERAVKDRRFTDKHFSQQYADCERLIKEHLRTLNNHEPTRIDPPPVRRPEPIPEGSGHTTLPPPVGQVDRSP